MDRVADDCRPTFSDAVLGVPERRRAMEVLIRVRGVLTVADLAAEFRVSRVTVRKDLRALVEAGSVHRFHGGAARRRRPG
ncbi:DeoR family transcriptional regulator [Actinotalea fermentans]|uniref:DeoR family transcriptional regulator n=1 Tax=Actinotalea fermentans TaxID=43671 RepID=UPI0011BF603F